MNEHEPTTWLIVPKELRGLPGIYHHRIDISEDGESYEYLDPSGASVFPGNTMVPKSYCIFFMDYAIDEGAPLFWSNGQANIHAYEMSDYEIGLLQKLRDYERRTQRFIEQREREERGEPVRRPHLCSRVRRLIERKQREE